VAEYVSTPAIRQRVTDLGVDYSQGYAISEPVPIAQALGLPPARVDAATQREAMAQTA